MPSIIAGTRARLTVSFKKDNVLFDPQVVLFSMWFTNATVGLKTVDQTSYQYGVDAQVVRTGVGQYYVEGLFTEVGTLEYTWRSTAWGEEVNVEFTVDVVARTVLEKA